MTLGGTPPELVQQARDGVVDLVWTVNGYTPGQFPRTEVFELPGVF
jgi:TRAP-type C4-dicarboxylate transport system substrate-binding protein